MKNIRFKIPDLHCKGCADRSRNILERLKGVEKAEVSYDDKSAKVEYNPDETLFEEMKKALSKANYTAEKEYRTAE